MTRYTSVFFQVLNAIVRFGANKPIQTAKRHFLLSDRSLYPSISLVLHYINKLYIKCRICIEITVLTMVYVVRVYVDN